MKIPYTKPHYSYDELLQAIQQKGYSHEDAEIILQYGHMTPGEQTACICGNALPNGSMIDIEAIHRRAKNNKITWEKHYTTIAEAEQYIAMYPLELKERALDKMKLLALEYYANSKTKKSLTKEEANTLAIRKYIAELKGAQQESRLFATPIPCTAGRKPAPPPTIETVQGVSASDNPKDYGRMLVQKGYEPSKRIAKLKEQFPKLKTHELGAYAREYTPDVNNKEACKKWYQKNR